jgi:serine/threonine protein kinase
MVTAEGRGKIMDFGIAHVMGSELTAGGDLFGSPYYMAPEQLAKGPITARTDLFAFAVVLYRMLTGVLPFSGDSFAAVAHSILYENPVPPERLDPKIGKALSNIVLRCLEKSPRRRAGSATDVLRALTAAESGNPDSLARGSSRGRRALGLSLAMLVLAILALRLQLRPPSAFPPIHSPAPSAVSAAPLPRSVEVTLPGPGTQPTVKPPAPESTPVPTRAQKPTVRQQPPPSPALTPPTKIAPPSEAELFYEARLALEKGDLERSRATLELLLTRAPSFAGASELYVTVTDRLWERHLPMLLGATHNHRLGDCKGELSLASLGVRYLSTDHDWAFTPADIRVMERPDETTFVVETFEKDALSLGKNKRYRFELDKPLTDADWKRYQRLLR